MLAFVLEPINTPTLETTLYCSREPWLTSLVITTTVLFLDAAHTRTMQTYNSCQANQHRDQSSHATLRLSAAASQEFRA